MNNNNNNNNQNNDNDNKWTIRSKFCVVLLIVYIFGLLCLPFGTTVGTGLSAYVGFTYSEVRVYNIILTVESIVSVACFAIAMRTAQKGTQKEFETIMKMALPMVILTVILVFEWFQG